MNNYFATYVAASLAYKKGYTNDYNFGYWVAPAPELSLSYMGDRTIFAAPLHAQLHEWLLSKNIKVDVKFGIRDNFTYYYIHIYDFTIPPVSGIIYNSYSDASSKSEYTNMQEAIDKGVMEALNYL